MEATPSYCCLPPHLKKGLLTKDRISRMVSNSFSLRVVLFFRRGLAFGKAKLAKMAKNLASIASKGVIPLRLSTLGKIFSRRQIGDIILLFYPENKICNFIKSCSFEKIRNY